MKIKLKGQWFEVTLTPIEIEEQSVVKSINTFDDEMLVNIESFIKENDLINKNIFRWHYEEFKEKYDKYNILTTKKMTLLFHRYAKENELNFNSLNSNGNRYLRISK